MSVTYVCHTHGGTHTNDLHLQLAKVEPTLDFTDERGTIRCPLWLNARLLNQFDLKCITQEMRVGTMRKFMLLRLCLCALCVLSTLFVQTNAGRGLKRRLEEANEERERAAAADIDTRERPPLTDPRMRERHTHPPHVWRTMTSVIVRVHCSETSFIVV